MYGGNSCITCGSGTNIHHFLCDLCLQRHLMMTKSIVPACRICGTDKNIINSLSGSPTTFICRACYNTTAKCARCRINFGLPKAIGYQNKTVYCPSCINCINYINQQMPPTYHRSSYNYRPSPSNQASPQMIKVEVTHVSELDAYDLKFVMPGRHNWDEVKGLIQVLKATIPASNREYHPDTKVWTLLADSYKQFEFVLKAANAQIIYIQESKTKPMTPENFFYSYSEPASSSKETKESLMDKLQKLLGCATADFGDSAKLKQLYRRKALEFHPDRNNGDGTRMSELNSIWSAFNA